MDLTKKITSFIEKDYGKHIIVEPEYRLKELRDAILDIINTYKPKVIIKAGLGNSALLFDLIKNINAYFVIVDPSLKDIKEFNDTYGKEKIAGELRFINGDFSHFPVDYYSADLLICNDILEFTESSVAIDEFRRALNFDAILLLGMVVLMEDDLEGVYDDFMRIIFPIHNDFYIDNDLKTVMDLNEFDFIKENLSSYKVNINAKIQFMKEIYSIKDQDINIFMDEHQETLESLYNYDNNTIEEPYYIGIFKRRKLDDSMQGKII